MEVFFCSDHHFGHNAILKHCKRPYLNTEEMDEAMITNWNASVNKGDIVYHLGDFAWKPARISDLKKRLNGSIHLLMGNHDRGAKRFYKIFDWVGDVKYIKVQDQKIMLCHYPMLSWRNSHRGSWMLHGHCHGTLKETRGLIMDVGVDSNLFFPVPFERIKEFMKKKEIFLHDYHGK